MFQLINVLISLYNNTNRSSVRVVSSTRSGMGKSLYIKYRAEALRVKAPNTDIHVIIPIHGPVVTSDTLMNSLIKHMERSPCTIYHLDIAPRVSFILFFGLAIIKNTDAKIIQILHKVDSLLFSLLVLNGLSDSKGNVWHTHSSQLYMVEVTIPEHMVMIN